MRKYKVAIIQMNTGENRDANLNRIKRFIADACEQGAKLIALPEVMNRRAADKTVPTEEPLDGPTISFMKACAAEFSLWIHCGSIREVNEEGLPYNTTVLLNDKGEIASVYRKLHLFDIELPNGFVTKESARNCPGDQVVDVVTDLGHLGMTICYDLRFPELFRLLALRGVEVMFMPANFAQATGEAHWESLLRARAIENSCYIIASAQTGQIGEFNTYGNSMIVDPWGAILARADKEECMMLAEIDLDLVEKTRQKMPGLKNRRSDVYVLETIE
jgi:predicted amidohydrolase